MPIQRVGVSGLHIGESRRYPIGLLAGLLLAAVCILFGLFLEGGHVGQVLQPTAAVIVGGGTLGAVLMQFSPQAIREAWAQIRHYPPSPKQAQERMEQIMKYAMQARRSGLVSLDPELKQIADPFLRKALMLAIDGISSRELRDIMELELARLEEQEEQGARVLEAAGGYAPTVGILGAVLGLIQVMQRLEDIGGVGRGIAVAFVSTLYGVGLANLLLLPLAGKLRLRAREVERLREMTLEGVVAIADGASPRITREKLGNYMESRMQAAALPQVVAR